MTNDPDFQELRARDDIRRKVDAIQKDCREIVRDARGWESYGHEGLVDALDPETVALAEEEDPAAALALVAKLARETDPEVAQ